MIFILETQKKFEILLKTIEKQRPGFIEAYGKGCSINEIHSLIPNRPIPIDLLAVYSCISGNNLALRKSLNPCTDIIPMYQLIPINTLAEEIESLENISKQYPELDTWKSDMIPFMKNESGDYYFIRSLEEDNSIWLLLHDNYDFDQSHYCLNMKLFFDFIIDCYKQKAYYLDENGYLNTDFELKEKIRQKYQ